jgi:regulator of protease activity HflC (stomatin/prohibitin superfamily)
MQPGLHVYWPPLIGRVDVAATRAVRTVEIGYMSLPAEPVPTGAAAPRLPPSYPPVLLSFGGPRTARIPEGSLFVTGDETLVAVTALLEYEIADAARYQLGVDHPEALLRSVARSVLVDAIGRTPIDALYSNARGGVEQEALAKLRQSPTIEAIGVRPRSLNLLYVHAPDEVHAAFRDVASAAEDRTTIRNQALVEAEGSVRLARGEAAKRVSEGESYRIQQVERARGNAAGFLPLAAEDRRSGAALRTRLYLEAMERTLANKPKLIKPDSAKAPGLELWITPAEGEGAGGGGPIPSASLPMDDEGGAPAPRPRPSPGP